MSVKMHLPDNDIGWEGAPIYIRISQHLKNLIESGELPAGHYLPAERDLAEEFDVSIDTIKKAMSEVKEAGYVHRRKGHGTIVTPPARCGTEQVLSTVLVLLGSVKKSFWAEIYGGVQEGLLDLQYKPVLIERGDSYRIEKEMLLQYSEEVAGFIIAPTSEKLNRSIYGELLAMGVPFVFIDRFLPDLSIPAVVSDNVKGGYLATSHLLSHGHRRIALVGVTEASSVRQRYQGYKEALEDYRVLYDENLVFYRDVQSFGHGCKVGREIASEHPDVTAAFCLCDDTAWGCMHAMSEAGVRVPEDFSIIGYDDNRDTCSRLVPQLTTVRQPKKQMGVQAARKIAAEIQGSADGGPKVLSLPVELIERESVGSAARRSEAVSLKDE